MIKKKSTLSFSDTNLFSPIILDFIKNDPKLLSFIDCFPSIDSINNKLKQLNFESRDILVQTLTKQYKNTSFLNGKAKNVENNIGLLLDSKTFTVCTGHQLHIFLSPLFLIYKVTSLIAYSRYLNKNIVGYNCVPCFWMATEDHDFNEINKLSINDKTYSWNIDTKNAIGNLSTQSIESMLIDMKKALNYTQEGRELYNIYYHAYTTNSNYADATRSILNALFGDYGLVVVDGNCKELKKLFTQDMKREITHNTIFKSIDDTNCTMRTKYKPQINALKSNIFYLYNNTRSKIEYANQKYTSLVHNKSWSKSEILDEIELYPHRFSPNVFMRTLYQQRVLPNILYVGGPSEIAYWLQLSKLFHETDALYPILELRSFFLILSNKVLQFYNKHNLNDTDLFINYSLKVKKIIQNMLNFETSDLKDDVNELLQRIEFKINNIDKFPQNSFLVFKKRVGNALTKLESKIIKFEKNNHKNLLDQFVSIEKKVFLNNNPQERVYSFIPYYMKYGSDFFKLLIEESLIFDNKYVILIEQD